MLKLLLLVCFFVLPGFAHAAGLAKPANNLGLIGYWSFNEGTSTRALDYSGKRTTGTLTGSPTWVNGRHGKALSFNGSTDYVALGTPTVLEGQQVPITITAWFKVTTSSGLQSIYSGYLSAASNQIWSLIRLDSGVLKYYASTAAGDFQSFGTFVPSLNVWHFVSITVSGSIASPTVTITLDGRSESSGLAALTSTPDTSVPIQIGGNAATTNERFTGLIDDVRVYSRALTTTEVTAVYKSGEARVNKTQSSVTGGLVGWWTLDGGDTLWTSATAGNAFDKSGAGNTGTLTNMNNASAPTVGKVGQALKFDGVDDYVRRPTLTSSLGANITLCMWMKTSLANTTQYVWTIDRNPGGVVNEAVFGIVSNKIRFWDYTGAAYGFPDGGSDGATTVTDGKWHHTCFTKSGTVGTYYMDGAADGATTAANNVSYDANDMVLGADYRDSLAYFNGYIDDVRVYSRALSAADVKQIYNEGVADKLNVDTASGSLTGGLVGYWSFNGADVTDKVYDRSGSSNNGYFYGGSTTTAKTIGKVGQALIFNGSSTYIPISVPTSPTAYTISAWVKSRTVPSRNIFVRTDSTGPNLTFSHELYITSASKFAHYTYDGSPQSVTGSTTVLPNTWYHVVAVAQNSGFMRLYVNGVEEGTATAVGTLWTGGDRYYVGSDAAASYGYFDGTLDELRVYNRALTAAEVKQLYLAGK